MIRRLFAAAPVLAVVACVSVSLSGCMSAQDLLKKDPSYFTTTQRSPQGYATCVADAWKREGGTVGVKPTDAGFLVTNADAMGLNAALTVEKWADGQVKVRMSVRNSYTTQDLSQAANLCSNP